jgi:hypothetical protein
MYQLIPLLQILSRRRFPDFTKTVVGVHEDVGHRVFFVWLLVICAVFFLRAITSRSAAKVSSEKKSLILYVIGLPSKLWGGRNQTEAGFEVLAE